MGNVSTRNNNKKITISKHRKASVVFKVPIKISIKKYSIKPFDTKASTFRKIDMRLSKLNAPLKYSIKTRYLLYDTKIAPNP